jgi:hypothetical protein
MLSPYSVARIPYISPRANWLHAITGRAAPFRRRILTGRTTTGQPDNMHYLRLAFTVQLAVLRYCAKLDRAPDATVEHVKA